jgi:hypothetical protein
MTRRAKTDTGTSETAKAGRAVYIAGKERRLPDANDHIIVHLNVDDVGEEEAAPCGTAATVDAYNCTTVNMDFACWDEHASCVGSKESEERYAVLLEEFSNKTGVGEWPNATSVHCHWCCHGFECAPVALPLRMTVSGDMQIDKCEVSGCFCSFQCAAAFNFEACNDADDMWERYSMLNRLFLESQGVGRIVPAPSRLTLKMFGGHMTIQEFRSKSLSKEVLQRNNEVGRQGGTFVDVLRVPMAHVPQFVEEVNEADMMQPLKFIPVDQERINKVREKLQLKRSKPLVNSKHTLDHVMNLRFCSTND